jgi:hypothetical protein
MGLMARNTLITEWCLGGIRLTAARFATLKKALQDSASITRLDLSYCIFENAAQVVMLLKIAQQKKYAWIDVSSPFLGELLQKSLRHALAVKMHMARLTVIVDKATEEFLDNLRPEGSSPLATTRSPQRVLAKIGSPPEELVLEEVGSPVARSTFSSGRASS